MSSSLLPPEIIQCLQQDYVASFDEKLAHLKAALERHNWEELYNIFHKLAGSGATYYMPEISILGRSAEKYFKTTALPDLKVAQECVAVIEKVFAARKKGLECPVDQEPILKKLA